MTEKLNITRIFNAIWELYKAHAGVLLTTAFLIYLAAAILIGVFFIVAPILALLAFIAIFVAQFWYTGMVIELVKRVQAGESVPTVGTLFGAVSPVLGRLIGAGLLAGLGIVVGLILLIVPGLYLITIWAVIAPAIVIEGTRVGESFGRSQNLVKGNGWQVFGTLVIIFILNAAVSSVLQAIFGRDTFLGGLLGTLIPNLIFAPVGALAVSVLYFELRRVKEGAGAPVAPAVAGGPAGAPVTPAPEQAPPPPPPAAQ
jgi:hypothetical protein